MLSFSVLPILLTNTIASARKNNMNIVLILLLLNNPRNLFQINKYLPEWIRRYFYIPGKWKIKGHDRKQDHRFQAGL